MLISTLQMNLKPTVEVLGQKPTVEVLGLKAIVDVLGQKPIVDILGQKLTAGKVVQLKDHSLKRHKKSSKHSQWVRNYSGPGSLWVTHAHKQSHTSYSYIHLSTSHTHTHTHTIHLYYRLTHSLSSINDVKPQNRTSNCQTQKYGEDGPTLLEKVSGRKRNQNRWACAHRFFR